MLHSGRGLLEEHCSVRSRHLAGYYVIDNGGPGHCRLNRHEGSHSYTICVRNAIG